MRELTEVNEKRIDKLESEMDNMQKTMKVDMVTLKKEMKDSIKEGFESCREIMPLKCQHNQSKIGLGSVIATSSIICSVVCGVIMFLAKSGLLDVALK